jgi:hypothetical protein
LRRSAPTEVPELAEFVRQLGPVGGRQVRPIGGGSAAEYLVAGSPGATVRLGAAVDAPVNGASGLAVLVEVDGRPAAPFAPP